MDIDVSKENIQPLRGGRNPVQLGAALQAQSDVDAQRQLQAQKEEHEASIRNYQGPDPLDPWFNYIQWVEQSYPKHGHEGHIEKLIKECLQIFEKDVRYHQDRRFVKLWIKYIDCLSNPLEIYQRLYNNGIGVECSEFYRAWACYCEESGSYKKANQIYMLGLQGNAQPLDELEQAHMNFQLFFAQRMLHDDSLTKRKAASALAETRMALTSLKSFKRRNITNVPVQRVGDSVKSVVPGVVRQGHPDNRGANSNVMLSVYEDAPSTSQVALPAAANVSGAGASLVQACSNNVENEKEVGIWTSAKVKMVHANVVPHQPLPFVPFEDEEDVLKLPPNHKEYCEDNLTFTVPLSVPDPPDPTKIPCYNKAQVYIDNTEYSLEEIRSRKYKVNNQQSSQMIEQVHHNHSTNKSYHESLEHCSALETLANCALDAEQDQLSQLMPINIPLQQNMSKVNMHSPGEPKVLVNLDSKELSQTAVKRTEESLRPSPSKKERSDAPANSSYVENGPSNFPRNNLAEEFNKSLMGNLMSDSITVNTKEARWELRNLFNDNAAEPSMVQPLVPQFQVPDFDIHEDRSMTMALHQKKQPLHDLSGHMVTPQDKENVIKEPEPTAKVVHQIANKTAYYEEPSCTQVFNYNIIDASTPNMTQFKKPMQLDPASKMSVPKFNLNDSAMDQGDGFVKKDDFSKPEQRIDQHVTIDNQGTVLSVIMEATRETSKSGSSSSGQSTTRGNFTGYTTTPYSEKTHASNMDSMYSHTNDPTTSKRNSFQPTISNGAVAKTYPQKREDLKHHSQASYHSHDHQYQKPSPQSYNNGFTNQHQQVHPQYQQNYNFQQGYPNQMANPHQPSVQQGYASPNQNPYQSPQHPGVPTPHMSPVVQPGFQSPPYQNQQMGYHSPGHIMSPQPYPRQDYQHYPEHQEQHAYHIQPHQSPGFQSPPHQTQYPNAQYYQRTSHVAAAPNQNYHHQNYHQAQAQNSYNSPNVSHYPNVHPQVNQSYNAAQNSYAPRPQQNESLAPEYAAPAHKQTFQIYQSPQPVQNAQNSFRQTSAHSPNVTKDNYQQPMQTSPDVQVKPNKKTSRAKAVSEAGKQTPQQKASALRNIRHEQVAGKNTPDGGFSNQFLNFITSRNEPKDNANTPKITNSPSISQKMHKNLYVSSPEQAQMPPSSGHSDSDSKDSLTAQTMTPIQGAKVAQVVDKSKDVLKRQLDFEQRTEMQSEDSRDSVGKESQGSSYSRQSNFQSDGIGMDVDSENSMEYMAYKSNHSISMIETSDIPRPADIDFPSVIDPFNKKLLASLLEYVKFPNKTHADGYFEVRSIPKIQLGTALTVGNTRFGIEKQLGKGNYGAVFLCTELHSNKSVAVKYQKPSRPWEFYICQELKARIKDPFMLPGYMDITTAYIADNASLFVSEFSKYGSLLDVANKVRMATTKCINEYIVFLLTAEMLSIVHYLHKAKIIHADIKPDNFLLMNIPVQEWRTPSLQLIDLGCSIDMTLFPEGTTFRELISTEGFTCTEMREGRPWTYQTDLYCLAGTIHVILMGSYMKVANRLGQWNIDKKLPRYMKISEWDKIFTSLLNIPDCNTLPDLMELKNYVDNILINYSETLYSQLRTFTNVLQSR